MAVVIRTTFRLHFLPANQWKIVHVRQRTECGLSGARASNIRIGRLVPYSDIQEASKGESNFDLRWRCLYPLMSVRLAQLVEHQSGFQPLRLRLDSRCRHMRWLWSPSRTGHVFLGLWFIHVSISKTKFTVSAPVQAVCIVCVSFMPIKRSNTHAKLHSGEQTNQKEFLAML